MDRTSRRTFISRSTSWAVALGLAPFLGSCEGCNERIRNRPMRRSLATLANNDPIIETYREAVAAMKALPAGDNRNWLRQAQIHFDHCPHGNWWFLPWHRAYLSYFEQICRDLTGNADFALPYWDWTVNASIPAPFWGAGNALFQSGRTATQTSTANAAMIGRPVIDEILDETDFLLFASGVANTQRQTTVYGRLEQTPHNHVHGFVGGIMGGYQSPQDPIFWMHHNMIECLWVEWNIVRQNANTNDAAWSGHTFSQNFFDTTGTAVDISVAATLLMPLLSYQFDGECGGAGGPSRMRAALADTVALRSFLERGGRPRVEIGRRFPQQQQQIVLSTRAPVSRRVPIDPQAAQAAIANVGAERLLLRVSDVVPPRTESFFVRVFVNMPDANPQTPTSDPHYAGSFAFFTDPSHTDSGRGAYMVDVTETLRRLAPTQPDDAVEVSMVAVPIHPGPPAADVLTIRALGLELARVLPEQ